MTWQELIEYVTGRPELWSETIYFYRQATGEFLPVDTIELLEGDYVISPNSLFLTER